MYYLIRLLQIVFVKHWGSVLILFLIVVFIAAGTAIAEAIMDVKARKKVPMYWCGKCQMFFKKEYALQLFPELKGVPENTWVCPMCYRRAVFTDPDKRLA